MKIPAAEVEIGKRYLFSCNDCCVLGEFPSTVLEIKRDEDGEVDIVRFTEGGWISRLYGWTAEEIPNA